MARATVDAKPLPLTFMVLPLKFFISLLYELALISKKKVVREELEPLLKDRKEVKSLTRVCTLVGVIGSIYMTMCFSLQRLKFELRQLQLETQKHMQEVEEEDGEDEEDKEDEEDEEDVEDSEDSEGKRNDKGKRKRETSPSSKRRKVESSKSKVSTTAHSSVPFCANHSHVFPHYRLITN